LEYFFKTPEPGKIIWLINPAGIMNIIETSNMVTRKQLNYHLIENLSNLKVAKDYKYGAGKLLLDSFNLEVLKEYLNISTPKESYNMTHIQDYIKKYAFNRFDFGRKKNVEVGKNNPLKINQGDLVVDNPFQYPGKKGWMGSYRSATIAFIPHRTMKKFLYRLPWMDKREEFDFDYVDISDALEEVKFCFEGVTSTDNKRRISHHANFRNTEISWDESAMAFEHPDFGFYHISKLWVNDDAVDTVTREILNAFRKRRQQMIDEQELKNKAAQVQVTYQDSIDAGNCKIETTNFARRVGDEDADLNDLSLRGDKLLEMRDDQYTRRAVKAAIARSSH